MEYRGAGGVAVVLEEYAILRGMITVVSGKDSIRSRQHMYQRQERE